MVEPTFCLSVEKKWYCRHVDIENAFPEWKLNRPVHPELQKLFLWRKGTESSDKKVHKSQYGFKEVTKIWHQLLVRVFTNYGFNEMSVALFICKEKILAVICSLDGLVLIAGSPYKIERFKIIMSQKFKLRNTCRLKRFLAFELDWSTANIMELRQRRLVSKLLHNTNLMNSKWIDSHTNIAITYNDAEQLESTGNGQHQTYRSIVGSIMYLASETRPTPMVTISMFEYNIKKTSGWGHDWG